ncbi:MULTISPECIES: hypothetical protein [unclassified Methylobacterium]|uniref:hypothetical protein n=1 Tax=unclassified Methylobacterium TaxID=2615210 RepID=UPI0008A765EC|nr:MULTISPECIES: hypothetical protein [unclassified Methylobacterium]SEH31411.1 hypothetical protein SAMN02799636_01061 [Methylobacterium sp. 275MFSha3.1]SFS70002.1 hypothetical protein SAMN04487845_10644 [Methylobacterium sp. yr668]
MTAALAAPVTQVCAFVLGCALIHAARAHADRITRLLAVTAVGAAVLVLLVASLDDAPEGGTFDEVTVYAAS